MDKGERISQEQFFHIITGKELSWQSLIYDLIKTEQLDPWDIDIGLLAERYLDTITLLEETDFFVSSKVLLACSLLLRLKSEVFLNRYIQDLDDALYGRQDQKLYEIERIEVDENDLPVLVPRTPMARAKKVTLQELITALDKAMSTEHRRIKKEIKNSQAQKSALAVLPRSSHVPLKVRIKSIFGLVKNHFVDRSHPLPFHEMAPSKEEQLASFVPVLHLANSQELFLRQPEHFSTIHLTLDMHPDEKVEMEKELGYLVAE